MFFGSTPKVIGNYFHDEIKRIQPKRVFSPFAGAFAIEQIVSLASPNTKLLSTDVTLFSAAIGFYLSDKETTITLTDEALELVPFLRDKYSTEDIAAAVLIFSDLAPHIVKAEKTEYYRKLVKNIIANFETNFEKAKQKLQKIKANIKNLDFYAMDAVELLSQVEKGDVVYFDPPYFQGDYEKMFKYLPKYFNYKEPSYTCIDRDMIQQYLTDFHKNGITAYYRCFNTNDELPEGYKLSMAYQHKYHAYHCIYTNADSDMFIKRFEALKERVPKYKIAGEDFIISNKSKIEFVKIGNDIANHYRMLWVKKAEMKQPNYSFLVLADEQVIGVICINSGLAYGIDKAMIISDPASPMTRYKRLSKLILNLLLTREFLYLVNELTLWPHTGFTTIAYTNNPVSMKYRSLFELIKREDLKEGNYQYKLTYHSKKQFDSIQIALEDWVKKYAD